MPTVLAYWTLDNGLGLNAISLVGSARKEVAHVDTIVLVEATVRRLMAERL